jgi:citronellol/citronellal dehydrogenase
MQKTNESSLIKKWGMTEQQLCHFPIVFKESALKGKRVLVSGGGTGIGQSIAILAARLGATVFICSRSIEKLNNTVRIAKEQLNIHIIPIVLNIRQPENVEEVINKITDEHGCIDILVNNSGGQFPQPALDFSVKGWNAVIDLNLNGTWYMMQQVAKHWVEKKQAGNIVNIVANVDRGMPQVAHTCAARAGVIYLSKSVSTEWAEHNIRVNCVAPGSIETSGFNVYPEGVPEKNFTTSNPMMRLGDVYDIASAVMYLALDTGKFITGETITVDGGMQQWGNCWPGGRPERFDI